VNEPDFAFVAALAGEPARAAMLAALFDGRAMPAGELARAAGVSAGTASGHLSKLMEGGLVRVRAQGRHRYYELARPEIAEVLEALGSIARPGRVRSLSDSLRMERLRFARSCYNHLAGELAIALAEALVRDGALELDEDGFRLCERGRELLAPLGIHTPALFPDPHAHVRACIDWTQRRPHISGPLGTALLNAFFACDALRRRSEPRALELTESGRALFAQVFGVTLSSAASADVKSA
jgi:DNA-binding transcriptional ArsR family regulator